MAWVTGSLTAAATVRTTSVLLGMVSSLLAVGSTVVTFVIALVRAPRITTYRVTGPDT